MRREHDFQEALSDPKRARISIVFAVIAAALLVVACGGDDDDDVSASETDGAFIAEMVPHHERRSSRHSRARSSR